MRATRRRRYSKSRAIKHSIKKEDFREGSDSGEKTAGKDNQSVFSLSIYECALSSCNNVDNHRRGGGRGEREGCAWEWRQLG